MSTTRRLLAALRSSWWLFGLGLLAEFAASALNGATVLLLVPLLKALFGAVGAVAPGASRLEPLVDRAMAPLLAGAGPGPAAGRIVLVLVAVLLLKNLLSVLAQQASAYVEEGLVRDLRRQLFAHLLRLDLGFFQRVRVGRVVSGLVNDTDGAKAFVPTVLARLVRNAVLIGALLAILLAASWRLTLLTLTTAPLLLAGTRYLLRHLARHSRAWTEARADLTARITERLGAIKLIRASGQEDRELAAFTAEADRYRRRVVRSQRSSALPSPVSELFGGVILVLVLWAATQPALAGPALGPTITMVFLVTALRLLAPLKDIAQVPGALAFAWASAERVFALLDEPVTEVDPPGAGPARFRRDLVFDRVSFRYATGERLVLEDVSFTIPQGEIVAIVGPSGAGKSTLLDLVPRFYDPTRGEIRLDGVPLTRLARASLRALIGVVGQETVLLHDTVFANIAFGRPEASRAAVEAAARAAHAAEFVAGLPQEYDTVVGERGLRLSGGQRQRIALARALLRDPPILILDEATSALDAASERLIQDAIERLMRDRTVLVIAHRLATVRRAGRIVVLDRGRVVEQGSHPALLAGGGLYQRLFALQLGREAWEAGEAGEAVRA